MIKGTIQQEDISLINIYAPNIGASKHVKQILIDIKREMTEIQKQNKTKKATKLETKK